MHMLDNYSSVDMVCLDFSKAFNKVDHDILLHKLRALGICGNIGIWLYHFLTNRSHFVRLPGGTSKYHPVCSKRNSLQAVELSQRPQTAVQIVSNPIYRVFLGASQPCGPAGWLALLLTKAGDVETNPGSTTSHKRVWICDIYYKQIHGNRYPYKVQQD